MKWYTVIIQSNKTIVFVSFQSSESHEIDKVVHCKREDVLIVDNMQVNLGRFSKVI